MKSFVTMEQRCCVACGKTYDTNALLLDKRMRDRFEHKTVTGWGLCPEHQGKVDEGFVLIIGCDDAKSKKLPNGNVSPSGAYRTGEIAMIKKRAFVHIFDVPVPDGGVCFCDDAVIAHLHRIAPPA